MKIIIKLTKIVISIMFLILSSLMLFALLLVVLYFCFGDEEKNKNPYIEDLYIHDDANTYLYHNFKDKEEHIKYFFDFAKNKEGTIRIVTDKKTLRFEDGALIYIDKTKQWFRFRRLNQEGLKNSYIRVYFPSLRNILFKEKRKQGQNSLYADFDSLNLNIVQNMLDFAKADSSKFDTHNYTYELFNKDSIKKIVITYHDKGEWFEIDILP